MYMDKILQKYVTDGDIKKELNKKLYDKLKATSSQIETSKPNLDGEDSVISILGIKIDYYEYIKRNINSMIDEFNECQPKGKKKELKIAFFETLIADLVEDIKQIDIQIRKLKEQYPQSSVKASAVKISNDPIEFNEQLTMELNAFDVEIDRLLPSLGLFGPIRMLLEKINIDELVALTDGKLNILIKYRTFVENELQHLPKSKKKKWRDILTSIGVELEPLANRLLSLQELKQGCDYII